MSRVVKRIGVVFGIVVGLVAVLLIGAEIWGRRWLARYAETWRAEIAAERQRVASLRMPVLRGEPVDQNAVPRYRRLLEAMKKPIEAQRAIFTTDLQKAVSGGPGTPAPPQVAALLRDHAGEIAALREAVRCSRADWELKYEDGSAAEVPPLLSARTLANLLVVEGHERARAGDSKGAAERYLDAARFGVDFGSGPLVMVMIGTVLDVIALEALGTLVASSDPSKLPLADVEAQLAKLEEHLPAVAQGIKIDRLAWGWLAAPSRPLAPSDVGLPGGLLGMVTPARAFYAHALSRMDSLMRTLERAMATENREERTKILAEVDQTETASWNPVLNFTAPSFSRAYVSRLDLLARYRLVRLALRVEQARGRDGRYPADPAGLDVPVDPHVAPARLRYQAAADGRGFTLWSAGGDGKDDGGKAEGKADLVLARSAP